MGQPGRCCRQTGDGGGSGLRTERYIGLQAASACNKTWINFKLKRPFLSHKLPCPAGQNYAAFSLDFPSRLMVVSVAEPVRHRREKMREMFGLEETEAVEDWRQLIERGKVADAAFICTQVG